MHRGVPIVLLIEHEPVRSVTLARVLKDGGYSVIPVSRANDALEIFGTHHRDIALVVADTQIPTSAGPSLVGALHRIDPFVPVILMSAAAAGAARATMTAGTGIRPGATTSAAAFERGADRYPNVVATLTKPIVLADLVDHVRRALQSPGVEARHLSEGFDRAEVSELSEARDVREPSEPARDAAGFNIDDPSFSWPPTEEDLSDIDVIDTRAVPMAGAASVRAWRRPRGPTSVAVAAARAATASAAALPLVPSTSPEPPAPPVRPAPVIRLVARTRDSHRGAPRFIRGGRWVAVAATVLCGVALTTLLEMRGAPIGRIIVDDHALTTAAAPVLAAREYGVGTLTLVPARTVRSKVVAARIHAPIDAHARSEKASLTTAIPAAPAPLAARAALAASAAPAALTAPAAVLPATTPSTYRVEAADARNAPIAPTENVDATREDERGIYEVLERYERAYERLDVKAARAVWPSLNMRALARAFDGLKEQVLEFSHCRVAMAPREATAICGGRASYVPRVGHQVARTEPREWTFRLRKVDQDWLIAKAEVR